MFILVVGDEPASAKDADGERDLRPGVVDLEDERIGDEGPEDSGLSDQGNES